MVELASVTPLVIGNAVELPTADELIAPSIAWKLVVEKHV